MRLSNSMNTYPSVVQWPASIAIQLLRASSKQYWNHQCQCSLNLNSRSYPTSILDGWVQRPTWANYGVRHLQSFFPCGFELFCSIFSFRIAIVAVWRQPPSQSILLNDRTGALIGRWRRSSAQWPSELIELVSSIRRPFQMYYLLNASYWLCFCDELMEITRRQNPFAIGHRNVVCRWNLKEQNNRRYESKMRPSARRVRSKR